MAEGGHTNVQYNYTVCARHGPQPLSLYIDIKRKYSQRPDTHTQGMHTSYVILRFCKVVRQRLPVGEY